MKDEQPRRIDNHELRGLADGALQNARRAKLREFIAVAYQIVEEVIWRKRAERDYVELHDEERRDDAMVRVIDKLGSKELLVALVNHPCPVAYLKTVAANTLRTVVRERRYERKSDAASDGIEQLAVPGWDEDEDEDIVRFSSVQAVIEEKLERLPPESKALVAAYFGAHHRVDAATLDRIAGRRGISRGQLVHEFEARARERVYGKRSEQERKLGGWQDARWSMQLKRDELWMLIREIDGEPAEPSPLPGETKRLRDRMRHPSGIRSASPEERAGLVVYYDAEIARLAREEQKARQTLDKGLVGNPGHEEVGRLLGEIAPDDDDAAVKKGVGRLKKRYQALLRGLRGER